MHNRMTTLVVEVEHEKLVDLLLQASLLCRHHVFLPLSTPPQVLEHVTAVTVWYKDFVSGKPVKIPEPPVIPEIYDLSEVG